MAWNVYWQPTGVEAWESCPAQELGRVITEHQPHFISALELDTLLEDSMTPEDMAKIRYRGSFYVDFDGESLEEVIPQANKFLDKLEGLGVVLNECELAVTGGRGFHVRVPEGVFIQKVNPAGYTNLPHTYKEMANELFVDTLDLRVYSQRKGRMWRTYNVQRPNGLYKVAVSAAEIRAMTPELYKNIASKRRPLPKTSADLTFSQGLHDLWQDAVSKVEEAIKSRKNRQRDSLQAFKGRDKLPKTLEAMLDGAVWSKDKGFQEIATQLAIIANELEWDQETLVKKAAKLCENHQSDGHRYNTRAKRENELRRMHQYMDGNPGYDFSVGAVANLLVRGTNYNDLRPPVGPKVENDGELEEHELDALCEGLIVRAKGIWQRVYRKETKEWEPVIVSNVGISDVVEMFDAKEERSVGFEVTVHPPGIASFKAKVTNNDFESKILLRRALGGVGHFRITDAHIGGLQTVLARMAEKGAKRMISLPTEGINVLLRPSSQKDPTEKSRYYTWWLDSEAPFYYPEAGETPTIEYRLDPFVKSNEGIGRSDLPSATEMVHTPESEHYLTQLLTLFPETVTAKVLGWYAAAFMCPILRLHYNQFPILQCFGTAGGGKTTFNRIAAHLHTHMVKLNTIATPHATEFALQAPLASSASIPVIFDEVKPREMAPTRWNQFKALARNNYDGASGAKGGIARGAGTSNMVVRETPNVAPMVFIGEAPLDQEAINHRCVMADFPPAQRGSPASLTAAWLLANGPTLAGLGRVMMVRTMRTRVESVPIRFEELRAEVSEAVGGMVLSRPLYNTTVVVMGLRTLASACQAIFGDTFKDKFESLEQSLLEDIRAMPFGAISEISRVISTLAHLSTLPLEDNFCMLEGIDWHYRHDLDGAIELNMRRSWERYVRYRRANGEVPLFDTEAAFMDALYRHPATIDRICADSPLKADGGNSVRVVRLSAHILAEENVDDFAVSKHRR